MSKNFSIKKLFQQQWIAVTIGNILLFIILAISQPVFMQMTNIMNILSQCSLYGIMSVGMTFVISTGGIDISVGMAAFFTMTLMWRLSNFLPAWLIFIIAILFGCIIGLCNGIMAAVLNFPDMIATLASMSILRGVGYLLIGSAQKFVPDNLRVIGVSRIGIVPVPMVIMLVIAFIGTFLMNNTRFGRYVLAVGGNKNSAVFSGLNVVKIRTGAYVLCGACAAIGGIVYAGRVGSISPNSCNGYEFTVITAVVLGGTKMSGGKSSVGGSVLGCVFLYLVENAMTMLNISSYYQTLARALLMLFAISIDTFTAYRNDISVRKERRRRFLEF